MVAWESGWYFSWVEKMCKEKRYYDGRGKQANSIYAYTNTRTTSGLAFLLFAYVHFVEREWEREREMLYLVRKWKKMDFIYHVLSLKMISMDRVT